MYMKSCNISASNKTQKKTEVDIKNSQSIIRELDVRFCRFLLYTEDDFLCASTPPRWSLSPILNILIVGSDRTSSKGVKIYE